MEGSQGVQDAQQRTLQEQAIEEAKAAYCTLPHRDAIFRQCVQGKETLADVISTVEQQCRSHRKKKWTKFLDLIQKYTIWLQNISSVVDIAVQTQAGIGCSLWAPIKFVLKISSEHSKATEKVFSLLESIGEYLPRLDLYQKLQSNGLLQTAILRVFTDVVDFSVRAFQFLRQKPIVRLTQLIIRSFDQDIGMIIARLQHHAKAAHDTAVAVELVEATDFRKEALRRQHDELRVQCRNWLQPSNVAHAHQYQIQAKLGGTCGWITSCGAFARWVSPGSSTAHDRLLVISGTQGRGKSVLASSIVVGLQNDQKDTLFFPFSDSDGSRRTSESLVRTLLWQCLRKAPVKENLDAVHCLCRNGNPTVAEFWQVLGRVAASLMKPVFCVVDGADECDDFDRSMFTNFVSVLDGCPNLRILLLGRSHAIQAHVNHFETEAIEITSTLLKRDIEAFIEDEVAKSDLLSSFAICNDLSKTLKDRSEGMFLWVRLMVDDLKKSSSLIELRDRMHDLPRGLEKAYQRVLSRLSQNLDKHELHLVRNILAFTITSCRPLDFDEFRYARALYCRSLETLPRPLEQHLIMHLSQRVLEIVGGMIFMSEGSLHIFHSSLREYLTRPEEQWVCEADRALLAFRIDIMQTHKSIALLCLEYLRMEKGECDGRRFDSSQAFKTPSEGIPLLNYAISYTFYHLNRAGPPSPETLAAIQCILESAQSIEWIKSFIYLQFEDLTLNSQYSEFEDFQNRMASAGVEAKFFAIFINNVEKSKKEKWQSHNLYDPAYQQLETVIDMTAGGRFASSTQNKRDEATFSTSEPCTSLLGSRDRSILPEASSDESTNALSRIVDLIRSRDSFSVTHQIEIWVRLQTSLRHAHVLFDSLKVLLPLILSKASGVSVYALWTIGQYYKSHEKYEEALKVYTAASQKMDHLKVPLKFDIYDEMAHCHERLGLFREALISWEAAYLGREAHLGPRHCLTLRTLRHLVSVNYRLGNNTEVLELCAKLSGPQGFGPELSIDTLGIA